jgi:trimethylamine--corrinoid protein Co-methyltransferase
MREVCLAGPGHYLGTGQTLKRMETDYVYPALGDRTSPKQWDEIGKPDLNRRATARKEMILAQRLRAAFDAATDKSIRAAFPIHLPC